MKWRLTTLALLLNIVLWAQPSTEMELKSLSQKRMQWLIEKRLDSLASLYDSACITVHGNGLVQTTNEQLTDISSGKLVYKKIDAQIGAVKDFGYTSILLGRGTFSMNSNGRDLLHNMVYTEVYVKKEGRWKLVGRQSTIIP